MIETRASHRYAKAILDQARLTGKIEETVADFAQHDFLLKVSAV